MKQTLKKHIFKIIAVAGLVAILLPGCITGPPTERESRYYNTETNFTPFVTVKTNVFEVYQTNTVVVTKTNEVVMPGAPAPIFQVVHLTNEIVNVSYETNRVSVTNQVEGYVLTPGPGAKAVAETAGAVGNLFGVGGITSTVVMSLFSLWGYARSKKSLLTAANLAQSVETIREFVKALPNGAQYDNELVNWLTQHQAESGVLNNVLDLLKKEVSNDDAKNAAQHIQTILEALKQQKPTV